jgi:hypothetical protein
VLTGEKGRQRQLAELKYRKRQRATEQRRIDHAIEKMIEAEPERGRRCKFRIAAADPALRKEYESNHQHHGGRPVTGFSPGFSHISASGITLWDVMYMAPQIQAPEYNTKKCV